MDKTIVKSIHALEVLDSRGNPTVSVTVTTEGGAIGQASVPSGASTGKYEAYEKRDGDPMRYRGKGRLSEVRAVEGEIATALLGMRVDAQEKIDELLCATDGTKNKSRLGAGAILATSMAVARAAANANGLELWQYLAAEEHKRLPVPMMNVLNGGVHADSPLDVQEFMIVPFGAPSFDEGLRTGVEIYHTLRDILKRRGLSTAVGDEGGFAPCVATSEEALDLLMEAIHASGYSEQTVKISLDLAASEWVVEEGYRLPKRGTFFTREMLVDRIAELTSAYPILSVEDPLGEDDFEGFRLLTPRLDGTLVVGDDLFVTNAERLAQGVRECAANAILIKPNQIGTVSETLHVIREAARSGYAYIVSHRSGETEDTFIADLAVATGAPLIKTGAPCRSERVAKYNRLLAIERALGREARYGL